MSKQSLYKTALTTKTAWDIPAGTYVAVEYAGTAYNAMSKQYEDLYMIGNSRTNMAGHVYENCLTSFCL